MENLLSEAILLATKSHEGQTRWDGTTPYIMHPLEVMFGVLEKYSGDLELAQIAVLHDVIEDCDVLAEQLFGKFSDRVVHGVACLTKIYGEQYTDYLDIVASNQDAIKVKLVDLEMNSRIDKQTGTDVTHQRQANRYIKYVKAHQFLLTKLK